MAYRKLGVTLSNLGMPRAQIDSALDPRLSVPQSSAGEGDVSHDRDVLLDRAGTEPQKAAEAFQQALNIDTSDMTASVNLANNLRQSPRSSRAPNRSTARSITSPRATQISMGNHAGDAHRRRQAREAESLYDEMARRFPAARAAQVYPVDLHLHARPVRLGRSILEEGARQPRIRSSRLARSATSRSSRCCAAG